MLKAIVFDFDGIIVDSEPVHFQAFLMVAKGIGLTFDYEKYLADFIGFDDRDAFRVMLDMTGFEGDKAPRIAELCGQKEKAFDALVSAGVSVIPGAVELIDEASAAMPVAIASGATRHDIDLMLEPLGRRDAFETIVSADDVARSKPDPQSYAEAVRRLAAEHPALGLQPGECLSIEDTAAGVASARDAGLMTLGVTTTGPASALREATRVIDTLEGVGVATLRRWYG